MKKPSKLPFIFGFSGLAGSGKTTAAVQLFELAFEDGNVICIMSMADRIKSMAKIMFNIQDTDEELLSLDKSKLVSVGNVSIPYRELLQKIGTEFGRDMISEDIWLENMRDRVERSANITDAVAIDDIRFENEAEFVRKNGVLIHVQRSNLAQMGHRSEAGVTIKGDDLVFSNDGDISRLRVFLGGIYNKVREGTYG